MDRISNLFGSRLTAQHSAGTASSSVTERGGGSVSLHRPDAIAARPPRSAQQLQRERSIFSRITSRQAPELTPFDAELLRWKSEAPSGEAAARARAFARAECVKVVVA